MKPAHALSLKLRTRNKESMKFFPCRFTILVFFAVAIILAFGALISAALMSACGPQQALQDQRLAQLVRQRLDRLELGMTRTEVLNIAGQPHRRDSFLDGTERQIEVLFYRTNVGVGGEQDEQSLTPVVLREGRVIGWGVDFYDIKKRSELKQRIEVK